VSFAPSELWEPAARRDPHAFYARVREARRPVPQVEPATGNRFWVVARHADVREGLLHPDIGHELERHLPEEPRERGWMSEAERIASRQLIALDPPDHTRLRRLVNTAFTPRTVARLEPRIVEVVDGMLARARSRGTVDGVADLGGPLPVALIADLVGVPEQDRPQFRAWSSTMISASPEYDRATLEFAAYIDELAARRRIDPKEDLLSDLVALESEGDALDRDELVAMVQLLLIAGQETTIDLVANGLLALLTHPDQWQALREDPSLAPAAVEEILRFDGPVEIAPPRFTFRELELAGGTIPAFETVALSILGANRDPEVFSDPSVFDLHRANARQHIAFGHGIHFCVGAPLARLEGRIMFERIAAQLPDLRLAADAAELRRTKQRLQELPLLV
jgi:cytochrome P450